MIRAEETPSANDELWKAIFDRSPTMYFIVDAAGITISVNAYGAEQLGYARDELVGSPVLNIFYETDREAVRRNVDRCFAQPDSHMSWEARKVRKDGQLLWVREIAKSTLLENRPVILVVCEAITEQKHAEEAARTFEILNKVSTALALEHDLHRLVQVVTDAGVELTGAEFGAFFYNVVNEQNESYMLYTLSGAPAEAFSKFPMPRNTAVFAPTFNGEGIVRSDDITRDPRYGKNEPRAGMPEGHLPVRSYLAVPVVSRSGQVLGGLFFGHAEVSVFSEGSERCLLGLAAEAAVAIDNARLTQAAQREIQERVRAEESLRLLNATLEQQIAQRTEALRQSERYLAEAQTLSHTGSWAYNPATRKPIYWSDEMFRIYGLDPQRGSVPEQEEFSDCLLPEDRDRVFHCMETAFRERTQYELDHGIVLPDGTVKYLHVIGHPVLDDAGSVAEFVGTSLDVTQRKQAGELQIEWARLAAIVSSSHDAIVSKSLDGIITSWNAGATRMFGYEATEMIGESILRIIPAGLRDEEVYILDRIRRGETVDHFDTVRLTKDGRRINVSLTVSPVRDNLGRIVGASKIARDVTERKRAEDERERLRQLEAQLAHINRVSMMGELAASLAHEMRQPIAAARINARACANWLRRDVSGLTEARDAASAMIADVNRAAEIIDRVRSLYKLDTPEREAVDVNDVVREMTILLHETAIRHAVSIHTELDPELPRTAADRVQLQQVLLNLMLNSLEAMKDEGGKLTVTSEKNTDGHLLISVCDSGVGISVEDNERVFEAFFTTKPQGSGMGLSISRRIVEAHGGRLWASPNSPRGAIFRLTVPVQSDSVL